MRSKVSVGDYAERIAIYVFLFLCPLIFSCASQAGGANSTYTSISDHTHNSLARELSDAAYGVLNSSRVRVTEDAAERLSQFIERGAETIGSDEVGTARRNIETFARQLVAESSFDESTGGRKVDAGSFQAALSICPLYPFC